MPMTDEERKAAHSNSSMKYDKTQDRIMIKADKTTGARIRAAAADAGKPLQRFILDIVLASIGDDPQQEPGKETE